jgi:kynurenine formamidase
MIVDLSYPLSPDMPVFPGYAPPSIEILDSTERSAPPGSRALNSSRLEIGLHTGTHMDAPFHFDGGGRTMERVPLRQCLGPASLVDLGLLAPCAEIGPEPLEPFADELRRSGRALIRTGWDEHWGRSDYWVEHPVITGEGADFLLSLGVTLVGVDFPSVDRAPYPAHVRLLGAGAVIVENLRGLAALRGRRFEFIAMPLALVGRDGCPVRAAARIEE